MRRSRSKGSHIDSEGETDEALLRADERHEANDAPTKSAVAAEHRPQEQLLWDLPSTGGDERSEEDGEEAHRVVPVASDQSKSNAFIVGLVIFTVATSVVGNVCRKFQQTAFGSRLSFFRYQLVNIMYDLLASVVVIYKLLSTNDITPSMRMFPFLFFCVLAFFDAFTDFLATVGGVTTPGNIQVLIQQLFIPFTMALAYAHRQRFTGMEYSGAATIVAGAVLATVPVLLGRDGQGSDGTSTTWYGIALFCGSMIPAAASVFYKGEAFKKWKLDPFFLTCGVSWTQVPISWVFVPLLALPGFGGIPLAEIPGTFRDGWRCFMGDESIAVYDEEKISGHCSSYATYITFIYLFCTFTGGVGLLYITKHGSATMNVLTQSLALPMSNLAFSIRPLMGNNYVPFSWYDVGGTLLCAVGFAVYDIGQRQNHHHHHNAAQLEAEAPLTGPRPDQDEATSKRLRTASHGSTGSGSSDGDEELVAVANQRIL